METGRLFWQAAGRSVEDGEVWCRFQQDDQGGGGGGDHGGGGGGDHGGGDGGGGGGSKFQRGSRSTTEVPAVEGIPPTRPLMPRAGNPPRSPIMHSDKL